MIESAEKNEAPQKEVQNKLSFKDRIRGLSSTKKIGLVFMIALLLGATAFFSYEQYKFENTDDAYVQANSTQIAPKVSGMVTHVLVIENQKVKKDEILVQLDQQDYVAALQDAMALLGSLQAQFRNTELDYERMKGLVRAKAISQQAFDLADTNYRNFGRQVTAAEARVEEARLNLDYTSVRAPSDGMIARRSIDVGMYAAAGAAILGFVPTDGRWVDANFKETQLSRIERGRPARVTVDAIRGKVYEGVVESVSPATGATFTLLPPDNATGNFTRVVQRVPVRILIRNLKPEDSVLLKAGLSAEVDIYKHRPLEVLPEPVAPVFSVDQIHASASAFLRNGQ